MNRDLVHCGELLLIVLLARIEMMAILVYRSTALTCLWACPSKIVPAIITELLHLLDRPPHMSLATTFVAVFHTTFARIYLLL
jgi:hypothetical protein